MLSQVNPVWRDHPFSKPAGLACAEEGQVANAEKGHAQEKGQAVENDEECSSALECSFHGVVWSITSAAEVVLLLIIQKNPMPLPNGAELHYLGLGSLLPEDVRLGQLAKQINFSMLFIINVMLEVQITNTFSSEVEGVTGQANHAGGGGASKQSPQLSDNAQLIRVFQQEVRKLPALPQGHCAKDLLGIVLKIEKDKALPWWLYDLVVGLLRKYYSSQFGLFFLGAANTIARPAAWAKWYATFDGDKGVFFDTKSLDLSFDDILQARQVKRRNAMPGHYRSFMQALILGLSRRNASKLVAVGLPLATLYARIAGALAVSGVVNKDFVSAIDYESFGAIRPVVATDPWLVMRDVVKKHLPGWYEPCSAQEIRRVCDTGAALVKKIEVVNIEGCTSVDLLLLLKFASSVSHLPEADEQKSKVLAAFFRQAKQWLQHYANPGFFASVQRSNAKVAIAKQWLQKLDNPKGQSNIQIFCWVCAQPDTKDKQYFARFSLFLRAYATAMGYPHQHLHLVGSCPLKVSQHWSTATVASGGGGGGKASGSQSVLCRAPSKDEDSDSSHEQGRETDEEDEHASPNGEDGHSSHLRK